MFVCFVFGEWVEDVVKCVFVLFFCCFDVFVVVDLCVVITFRR